MTRSDTVGVSTLARHRRDYRADYAVVVAPGFEGGDDNEDSALIKECREHGVTPIRIRDLALLVQIAAARNVGFATLRSWLGKCRTPGESHRWVLALLDEPEQRPPLLEVLTTIANLQATQNNPVTIQTITLAMNMNYQLQLRNNEVRELVTGLRRLTENYLTISGDTVRLEMAVEKVRRKIAQASHEIDPDILRKSFLQPLIDAAED